jgi:hypothetical protein
MLLISTLTISQGAVAQEVLKSVRAQNPSGDLRGENWRVRIFVMWPAQNDAKTYIIYRALSINERWVELAQKTNEEVIDSGTYEDVTDLAQTNSLCYKIEPVNELGQLLRVYEAVCVPKYVDL